VNKPIALTIWQCDRCGTQEVT